MHQYKITFSVDGRRTEQIVSANSTYDAKRLIEAQYPNCKINFLNIKQL